MLLFGFIWGYCLLYLPPTIRPLFKENMRNKIIFACSFFLFNTSILLAQSDVKLSSERYNSIYDSLMTKKKSLLSQKESLIEDIDSLKTVFTELDEKWRSSRKSQLVRKYGKDVGGRVASGQVWRGMSEKMLQDSWGKPDKISKNKEKWGTFTQWYYGEVTYFFKDSILTDWEEKK